MPMELSPFKALSAGWLACATWRATRAARYVARVVSLGQAGDARRLRRFRTAWRETRGAAPLPLMGLGRFIVVAQTTWRRSRSRRAYPRATASRIYMPPCSAPPRIRARRVLTDLPRSAWAWSARPRP
jgi:hypothetical protein